MSPPLYTVSIKSGPSPRIIQLESNSFSKFLSGCHRSGGRGCFRRDLVAECVCLGGSTVIGQHDMAIACSGHVSLSSGGDFREWPMFVLAGFLVGVCVCLGGSA